MRGKFVSEVKELIELLKERPHSLKDLIEVLKKDRKVDSQTELDALRKRTSRHLQWLDEWNLAHKRDDGRWYWYLSIRKFAGRGEYDMWMNHSEHLIPALESIGKFQMPHLSKNPERYPGFLNEETASDVDPELIGSARNHLKAYPDIDGMLTNVEKVEQKFGDRWQQVREEVLKRLRERFGKLVVQASKPVLVKLVDVTTEPANRVYVGENVPDAIYILAMSRLRRHPEPTLQPGSEERIMQGALIIGKGKRLFRKIESFVEKESRGRRFRELVKLEEDFDNAKTKLEVEIRWSIIKKIDHGEPLMGHCDLCPNVKITI